MVGWIIGFSLSINTFRTKYNTVLRPIYNKSCCIYKNISGGGQLSPWRWLNTKQLSVIAQQLNCTNHRQSVLHHCSQCSSRGTTFYKKSTVSSPPLVVLHTDHGKLHTNIVSGEKKMPLFYFPKTVTSCGILVSFSGSCNWAFHSELFCMESLSSLLISELFFFSLLSLHWELVLDQKMKVDVDCVM